MTLQELVKNWTFWYFLALTFYMLFLHKCDKYDELEKKYNKRKKQK